MSQAHRVSVSLVCLVVVAGGAAIFAACGGGGSSTATTAPDSFCVAPPTCADSLSIPCADPGSSTDAGVLAGDQPIYATNFENYASWQTFNYSTSIDAGPHLAGNLTAWINKLPPHGATEFPVGTIIIKRIGSIPQTFAMEKRADDYNADGAAHWEYFELQTSCDGKTPSIVWRGFGPPVGESYGGDPLACNDCHVTFKNNDFIGSSVLQLGNF
jgi:hypothetical protein